jgi:hypothetical protein
MNNSSNGSNIVGLVILRIWSAQGDCGSLCFVYQVSSLYRTS